MKIDTRPLTPSNTVPYRLIGGFESRLRRAGMIMVVVCRGGVAEERVVVSEVGTQGAGM